MACGPWCQYPVQRDIVCRVQQKNHGTRARRTVSRISPSVPWTDGLMRQSPPFPSFLLPQRAQDRWSWSSALPAYARADGLKCERITASSVASVARSVVGLLALLQKPSSQAC
ncbi:hypothetical protein NHX12_011786 [Muraenolepis orangiensis]|uniref:Uncharacterized protein n=1 Tax=Muraenolepis orangiensis TaxID=630683 RepID=A0A9Q0I618_9TELE|nr:hypothetical protein NHX12_011786 [Muraenolepis orangiensis]